MRGAIARLGDLLTTVGRQAVPLSGVFAWHWQPVSAIAVYWLESLLLALVAVLLCALVRRRSSPEAVKEAGIDPKEVFAFHVGGILIMGIFVAMVLVILIGNGRLDQRFEWREFRDGAAAVAAIVAIGLVIDLWGWRAMTVPAVRARVDACMSRWALFWLLGFFGVGLTMLTGRGWVFIAVFGGLKLVWEVWAALARVFGWQSLAERQAGPA
jgi:hypothetical protein